jgi:hypothetical protein
MCLLLALSGAGCGEAKKLADESKEGLRAAQALAGYLKGICDSLSTNNFVRAKELGGQADDFFNTRALSWCVQVLTIEEKEGVDAAKASIQRLKQTEGATTSELGALAKMETYFERKGADRTGDLVVMIGVIVAEKKYGHGAGGLVSKLCAAYRTPPRAAPITDTNAPPAPSK